MKVELDSCFILHHRPYRETSLILDVFSKENGRLSLVAKGARRNKKTPSNVLQSGRKLNISWFIRGEMGTLTAIESAGPAYKLSGRRMISCFYMNELLIRMLHKHEAHPELFLQYENSMTALSSNGDEDRVLRLFEKHLLKSLGYGLVLDHEIASGEAVRSDHRYYYQPDYGPVTNKPVNVGSITISGRTLIALQDENSWDDEISKEAKQLFRAILDMYIGDRPLGSRTLYKAYLQNAMTS